MIIRFSFKDIEDMIKNKLPMMGVDASFHWNPENKDFNKMSLRDMEEYTPKGRRSGREHARNMSIKYKIASITILVALIVS